MIKRFLPFALIFYPLNLVVAQESDTTKVLQDVVIMYRANKRSPVTFLELSAKDLKLRSYGQEPSFLLAETPSITNFSDAGSGLGYSYFRIRGIDQTRINITLDGMPLNEPEDQGAYFSNYPDLFNSLSKVHIQRGVGTTKNGVASFGGSVQLFSPVVADSMITTVGLAYGSFNTFRAFASFDSGLKKNKSLHIRASELYSDGYKYDASNSSRSLFTSGSWFTQRSAWKINLVAGQQRNQLAWLGVSDSLIALDRRTNANVNERDRFVQCLAQLLNNTKVTRHASVQSSIYYTYLNGDYDFNLNTFLGLPSTNELYNYAFQSHLAGFFSNFTLTKRKLNWVTGVHGNRYNRSHTGSEITAGELYTNTGFKNEFSAFTKVEYKLSRFTLFADVQYRYTTFNYEGTVMLPKKTWQFINPKAGFSFVATRYWLFYGSIGSTGREPTRNDLFGGNDDLLADSLGNALLFIESPEYVTDVEIGGNLGYKKLSLHVNLFYMDFRNEITLNGKYGPNGLALTNNVESSIRTGAELSLTYHVTDQLSLVNHSSYNFSQIKEQGETFAPILTPRFIINQEVVYNFGKLYVAVSGRFQDQSFIDFANTATIDRYFLLNSRAGWKYRQLEIAVFANNLTNAKYFNNGYIDYDGSRKRFVQAPMNASISLKYSF